ncbi:cytosine methyltransferase [Ruegeria sp. ANG-S4]|uniref:DNA (cytosine-5-)-methyltransferase n=1 Tax=Ruegeria sp. ANG-S4 TaxID=1577904 RepID=UPI00057DFC1C|nr:DNA (cytosine-5-)-methyltransferase [Ruegeria sp. ANG-S4]KIC45347.1 cytosine methyltransferase [Ruegeria sp. ANG-S4]
MNFTEIREQTGLSVPEVAGLLGRPNRTVYNWEEGRGGPKPAEVEKLLAAKITPKKSNGEPAFRFIDLFAGIGGLRRAFDMETGVGGQCVFTSEWDKYARITYSQNYGETDDEIAGDITQVSETEIPQHEVLLAGFPCQPFSIAGVSKKNALKRPHGFACEDQGNLFFDVARIVKHHRPKAILLENVRNLANHDKGRTFRVIRQTLEDELEYDIFPMILDAKSWVPQHRQRIFIVGFPRERKVTDFSLQPLKDRDPLSGPKLSTILHPENGTEKAEGHFTTGPKAKVSEKYVLTEHLWNYLQRYAEKHRAAGNGFGFGLNGPEDVARTLSARYYKDGSEILIRRPNGSPRRLTPRECARLMGFDKPGESSFKIKVSDTQAYKQFGNAVVAPVATDVARLMLPHIAEVAGVAQAAQEAL